MQLLTQPLQIMLKDKNNSVEEFLVNTNYNFIMDTVKQVFTKVRSEYSKNATKKLMMIDALACYCVVTGLVQVWMC